MTDKVKELTDLSKESMKARANLDRILDFVDLINKRAEEIEGDVVTPGDGIKELSDKMGEYIDQIKSSVDGELDKIPVDPEETKEAAEKLLLFHGSLPQVIAWADTQKSGHKQNSYWWRYWVSVLENALQLEIAKGSPDIKPV
ncbi:MAG TPA: hypothetical protein PKC29_00650 [Thermodesulfobacteriota bacterium]|nr:hypothetical protein [Thermodesulfobacteriota bacterium]